MNKTTFNSIISTTALASPSDLKSVMVTLQRAGRQEFGDEFEEACSELKRTINSQVDINQIGVFATYALICTVNNTDERLTRLVMSCAADQWLEAKQTTM